MPQLVSKSAAGLAAAVLAVASIGTMVDVPAARAEPPAATILIAEIA